MYKKILYTILSVVTMLSVAACGSSDSGKEPTKTPKATEAPKNDDKDKNEGKDLSTLFDELEERLNNETVVEVTPIAIPTEVPADDDEDFDWDDNDSAWGDDDKEDDTASAPVAVADGVIIDNDQCSFKILSVDENSRWGYTLNVQVENKTDLNLCFSMDDVYVNDVYCDPFWYCDADAGETVTDEIDFYGDELESIGITDVTSITFLLTVYDNDDWSADNLVESTYVFYPEGEENAVSYEYTPDEDDIVLVDNDEATFIVRGYEDDETWGYLINVYMENHTNNELMFSLDDATVNGFLCDTYWAASLPAGMKSHSSITLSKDVLERSEISTVTVIEFLLTAYNYDDWEADNYLEDTFTLYPLGEAAAQYPERTPKDSDIVLFDNDSCTMILTDFTNDEIWGYSAIAYIENKTDRLLFFNIEDGKINGTDCDPFWTRTLAPGKKYYSEINWSSYKLEDSGITEIESLELPVTVNDYSNLDDPEVLSETFTVTP